MNLLFMVANILAVAWLFCMCISMKIIYLAQLSRVTWRNVILCFGTLIAEIAILVAYFITAFVAIQLL